MTIEERLRTSKNARAKALGIKRKAHLEGLKAAAEKARVERHAKRDILRKDKHLAKREQHKAALLAAKAQKSLARGSQLDPFVKEHLPLGL